MRRKYKSNRKPKRMMKRRVRRDRQNLPRNLDIHRFNRNSNATYITSSSTPGIPLVYQGLETTIGNITPSVAPFSTNLIGFGIGSIFRLSSVANFMEYVNLFDQYRIRYVITQIDMLNAMVQDNIANNFNYTPELYIVNDYDDGNAPGPDVMNQYQNVKVRKLSNERTIKIKYSPKLSELIYQGELPGGQSAYANPPGASPWIDCVNVDVQHYGLKIYCDNFLSSTAGLPVVRIQHTYFLEFRTQR